jgi:predicted transcriptional regulator
MTRFNDQSLHIMIHLSGTTSRPIIFLCNAIKSFTKSMLEPLVERGWATLRPSASGDSIVEITDAGEAWLRKVCDISNEQPKIP